jgi:peptidoglycan/LPS O-acetylase OafA/YrhL
LGKISYGLYLWHCIVIVFVFKAFVALKINIPTLALASFILYVIIVAVTIFISWISYTFFESFFLRLKKKFSAPAGN